MPKTLDQIFRAQGVVIGENHHDISPKKFLIQNFRELKARGYNVLFLEHFSRSEHQPLIDQYYTQDEMPEDLKSKIAKLNEGHMGTDFTSEKYRENSKLYNFLTLIQSAKESGIEIVCLEKSEKLYRNSRGRERVVDFNEYATAIIQNKISKYFQEHNEELKWLAFIGTTHVNECQMYKSVGTILGVAQRLANCENIIIFGCDSGVGMFSSECVLDFPTLENIYMEREHYLKVAKIEGSSIKEKIYIATNVKYACFDSFTASFLVSLDYKKDLSLARISEIEPRFNNIEDFYHFITKSILDNKDFVDGGKSAAASSLPNPDSVTEFPMPGRFAVTRFYDDQFDAKRLKETDNGGKHG